MNGTLLLLCLLAALPGWAQPGGGGGLNIRRIYGREAGRLVPLDSATVHVRQFVLGDAAALAAYQAGQPYRSGWYPVVDTTAPAHNLPRPSRRPRSLFDTFDAAVRAEVPAGWHPLRYEDVLLQLPSPNMQRLQLVYRADTMVVDVSNLPHGNGMGYRAQLDSLVVMPGYFGLSYERRPAPGEDIINLADTLGDWQRGRGFSLTPSRIAGLRTARYLDYRPVAPGSRQLPNPAILRAWMRAYRLAYYPSLRPQAALAALAGEQAAGVPLYDARTCLLRADCYQQLGQPLPAEQWLTQALCLTPSLAYQNPEARSDLETLRQAYEQRMALRLRGRRYPQALADYDSLAALQVADWRYWEPANLDELLQHERAARLAFLTDSLHERGSYRATMEQLRADLEPTLTQMWRCRLGGVDAHQLYQLATAEYHCGEVAAAYQHWQLFLIDIGYSEGYVEHFTKLLTKRPDQPDLLLCRALAYLAESQSRYSANAKTSSRAAALRDLQRAGRLRPHDFRVNYFRAKLYQVEGKLSQAVAELDQAITKEAQLPVLYRFRHELRVELKQVVWYSRTDPDYARYSDLCTNGY